MSTLLKSTLIAAATTSTMASAQVPSPSHSASQDIQNTLRTTPPENAEVRDLSDRIELHSSTVTIDGQEVTVRRYRDPNSTAMITAWPSNYQWSISGNRIENVTWNPSYHWNYGTTNASWMTRDDLPIAHYGIVDDIEDVTGSGQSRREFYLTGDNLINYQFVTGQSGIDADNVEDIVGKDIFDPNNGFNERNNIRDGSTYILGREDDTNNDGQIDRSEAINALNTDIADGGYAAEIAGVFSTAGARVDANIYDAEDLTLDVTDNLTETYGDGDALYFTLTDLTTGEPVEGVYRGRAEVDMRLSTHDIQDQQPSIRMAYDELTQRLVIDTPLQIESLQLINTLWQSMGEYTPEPAAHNLVAVLVPSLASGTYFIRYRDEKGNLGSQKIIIK